MPAAACQRLPPAGTIDVLMAVLLPCRKVSFASTTTTSRPRSDAARAAARPAAPAPATRMSVDRSHIGPPLRTGRFRHQSDGELEPLGREPQDHHQWVVPP